MNAGIMVAAGVVGALALCETVLPWAFAALRRWGKRAKEAGVVRTQLPPANASLAKTDVATTARNTAPAPQSAFAKVDAKDDGQGTSEEARRLWEEARGMAHRFTPDWEKDREYLSKIHAAARLGHLEAMTKLGEYAGRREAVVEAFYWTLLAELKGARGLKVQLRELRLRWQALGCPEQYGNAYVDFTEEQGVFARAVLRLQCGVDPQYARARLKELADRGVEEARLFLGKDL